jgi:site-specific DNA-cytosine methylase
MTKIRNVLSLFDGMSCGQLALEKAGVTFNEYYASEIDPWAIQVAKNNFPDTVHLGDVTELESRYFADVDLLIGGSPCQSFSNAGDGTGFDGSSKLFWEYVRLLKEINPKYFLLENVVMRQEWQDIISEAVGVQPIAINSRLLSAQNRPRLYWTNIPNIEQPEDLGLTLSDILVSPNRVADNLFLSDKAKGYMSRERNGKPRWEYHTNPLDGKSACLTANMFKGVPYGVIRERMRRLTPIECERLQTLPDDYTKGVSNTQRYKMIGNGWTADVIAHIFKNIKQ